MSKPGHDYFDANFDAFNELVEHPSPLPEGER